ncbi:MAG: bifunctional folylpolyglutamate synthase/dihydrofolate synthase [Acidobacteria bacterium]|nr:bifunctional folylpolyglutamate synthase/dihydrofolate synthase [Acidobacteriota bacterium]
MADGRSIRQRLESIDAGRINPGLDRIRRLLEALGNPQLAYPTAIIGGTNGKGSVAAMLTAIGRAAGHRIGLYTSPHLTAVEERFQVDGAPISASGLDAQLGVVLAVADKQLDSPPSYFEILTAVAFRYFAEAHVELAVLEVGLGGRWDATNVTRPRVAVISSVALDHQEYLGEDVRVIAAEKAAIIPPGGMAVTAPQGPAILEVIRRQAELVGATLWETESFPVVVRRTDAQLRYTFDCVGQLRHYVGLEVPLPGAHQVENAQCAILAAEVLDRRRLRISSDAIWAGLRSVRWPGRCEWLEENPPILLDAAHNPAAAQALASYLRELRRRKAFDRLHLVFSTLTDKDTEGIAKALYPLADHIVATRAPSKRATPTQELLAIGTSPSQRRAVDDPAEALAAARDAAAPEDLICVCGSTYLIGAVRPLLIHA